MRSTFFGLETARRALAASQRAMDVAGHNIANANAPGYTRQQPVLSATDPYTLPSFVRPDGTGQVGTGVEVMEIRRLQSDLLETQSRQVASELGTWASRDEALSQLGAVVNEPGESGLHSLFDAFWGAWHALSTSPADPALRSGCLGAALTLCDGLRRLAQQVESMQAAADQALEAEVAAVNSQAHRISELNNQIRSVAQLGDSPNDLLDQRDLLLAEVACAADIRVREHADATVTVTIGGFELVQQFGLNELATRADPSTGFREVIWAGHDLPASLSEGRLAGIIDMRDGIYGSFLGDLDQLASGLVAAVNGQHQAGFDANGLPGGELFDSSSLGARDIRLSSAVTADLSAIAASATGEPGDGGNALAIARLEDEALASLGNLSLAGFYQSVVSSLGSRGREAERAMATQELLARQISSHRSAVSGVSLDEEMIRLMEHQHAYNAAARLLTAMDEMLMTLIDRLGAGR
jgi:flagellar hook-associated protein 1 FlgK